VSCPDAAGSGVIEAAGGAADAVAVPADAEAVADGDGAAAVADVDGAAADVEELPADEHPASVTSTAATAASAARGGRMRRTATDDTDLPTTGQPIKDVDPTPDNVPVLVTAPGAARNGIRNNGAGTPAFASRRVGLRKGK
jgi:hypothetical protein